MKCKKCGYRATDIAHMAAHYRKKHPKSMERKKQAGKRASLKLTRQEWNMIGRAKGWL